MKRLFFLCSFFFVFPLSVFSQTAIVTSVTDGDTFRAMVNGTEEKIRLIGIDTPELHANSKANKDSKRSNTDLETLLQYGMESKRFVETLIRAGDTVKLETDIQVRDKYKRLLAYVFLSGGRMLNDLIVSEGFGYVATFPPNVKYQERFLQSQQTARTKEKGLWKKIPKQ